MWKRAAGDMQSSTVSNRTWSGLIGASPLKDDLEPIIKAGSAAGRARRSARIVVSFPGGGRPTRKVLMLPSPRHGRGGTWYDPDFVPAARTAPRRRAPGGSTELIGVAPYVAAKSGGLRAKNIARSGGSGR
jgi:hypothetical protein